MAAFKPWSVQWSDLCDSDTEDDDVRFPEEPGYFEVYLRINNATAWAHRGNCLPISGSDSLCFMRLLNVCAMRPIGACDSLFDPPYSFSLQPCRHSSTAFQTVPVLNEWTPSVAFVVLVISIKWNCGGSLGICCRGSTPTRGLQSVDIGLSLWRGSVRGVL